MQIRKNVYLCIAKEKDKVPWMSGLVSGLQNRARRFESARNLHKILITPTTCTGVVIRIFLFIDNQHISNFHPPTTPHRQAAQKRCAPSPPGMYAIFARYRADPGQRWRTSQFETILHIERLPQENTCLTAEVFLYMLRPCFRLCP